METAWWARNCAKTPAPKPFRLREAPRRFVNFKIRQSAHSAGNAADAAAASEGQEVPESGAACRASACSHTR